VSDWPPATTMSPGDVAREIIVRLTDEFHIDGIRSTGAILGDDGWIARVGLWPDSEERIDSVRKALAPLAVTTHPRPGRPRRL